MHRRLKALAIGRDGENVAKVLRVERVPEEVAFEHGHDEFGGGLWGAAECGGGQTSPARR